jgi:tetratricopeptide (TPR) repeat protein
MSMLCSQCGASAERCARCAGALCARRLCAELHEVSCSAVSSLPAGQVARPTTSTYAARPRPRRQRNPQAESKIAQHLVLQITQHRQAGRSALVAGDLDTALDELWAARLLEPDLDGVGATARDCLPRDWEIETDLTPLARALSARLHPRATDAWRRLLDDRPARSVQAEAAEWLAREAFGSGNQRAALRILHAASLLGRGTDADAFHVAYRQAGVDPAAAFSLYLAASRVDPRTARAVALRDPLTDRQWSDQDARWWTQAGAPSPLEQTDHQLEALRRARDLAHTKRDQGWLLLAEGDHTAGPLGVRTLGRNVRAGCAEPADEDSFVRIRVAYDGAADRLPDVAWPWYRLAELLAWAGFGERAQDHLAQAERRGLGRREVEHSTRPLLRALVFAGLGTGPDGLPTAVRPFPTEPFGLQLAWRLKLR